ncbi:peptidoglycan DD-metalloendopeptidase family protein [Thalassotalea mangrovi]|uniref:Peptidase M24 n=1 Tax=Thalassotalea mangrovi TaxID=2572245 RepID=A0A4U1BAN5_9GAMM|nr:peptidoglycan DD-metalloendopeptidase family protein [Thalassotalea mangrovi]TKB47847.1 peptidase M24 [Thalassotalea mangrovi]
MKIPRNSVNTLNNIIYLYSQLPRKHQMLIICCSIFMLFLLVLPSNASEEHKVAGLPSAEVGKVYPLELSFPEQPIENTDVVVSDGAVNWQTVTVKSGDSLGKILSTLGFSAKTTHQIATTEGADVLKRLKVGDEIQIASDGDSNLVSLSYTMSPIKTLLLNQVDSGYAVSVDEKQIERRISYAQATIKSNFWNAALGAGMTNAQIMNLANIFGWDIDFALDIRAGDNFSVMYENEYIDGEFVGHGAILAAEFENQGELFQAVRFKDGEYYTPSGKSMRKSFLRAPVSFNYISSNFKPKRYHPILKRYKAHNGVDYRAPTGTPVKAAGNGRVIASTYNKYNGNYVFIQHANNIVTKYLHFSKRAVKKGQRVKQGQVIGYVGSTGLSQAPHLHYEFLLNGVHRNPRTVKLPDALPIDKKYKEEFTASASQLLTELLGSKRTLLAATDVSQDQVAE